MVCHRGRRLGVKYTRLATVCRFLRWICAQCVKENAYKGNILQVALDIGP